MLACHQKRIIKALMSNIMRYSRHYQCKYIKVGKSTSTYEPIIYEKYYAIEHISRMYTRVIIHGSVVSSFGLL